MKDRAIEQNRWESAERYRAVESRRTTERMRCEKFSLEGVHWQIQTLNSAQSTVMGLAQSSTAVPKGGVRNIFNSSFSLHLMCSGVDFIGLQWTVQG